MTAPFAWLLAETAPMSEQSLLIERIGAVLRLTLNRPQVGNALDIPLAEALMKAAISADEDDDVRAILITGSGRLFCAGGDVAAFGGAGDKLPTFLKEITAYLHVAITRLIATNKPVISAINGAAAGAGVGLALVGDIVLLGSSAQLNVAYTAIGLSPDGGTSWLLPRLVGLRKAQELCLTNRRVAADEAEKMGLATRVVPDAELQDEALALANKLASGATGALGATRHLLRNSFSNGIEAQLELEGQNIAKLGRSRDGREGIAAFIAKRPPVFGRES